MNSNPTPRTIGFIPSQLVEFGFHLKNGYRESTIERYINLLRKLEKQSGSLEDPEAVKATLAEAPYSTGTKDLASHVLANYYRFRGFPLLKPNYVRTEKLPFIPLEAEIDSLISGAGPKMSTFLQMLKETGARCGEGWKLGWRDIDTERGLVTVTPEKGSRPRQFKISPKLCSMLSKLPRMGPLSLAPPKWRHSGVTTKSSVEALPES